MECLAENDATELDRVDRLQSTVAETALAAGVVLQASESARATRVSVEGNVRLAFWPAGTV